MLLLARDVGATEVGLIFSPSSSWCVFLASMMMLMVVLLLALLFFFESQLTDVFFMCCRCSSCSALALALLVAPASRARCALGAGRGAGYITLVFFCRAAAASCARCTFGLRRGAIFLNVRRAAAPPRAVGRCGLEVGRRVALPISLLLFAVLPLFFFLVGRSLGVALV